MRFRLLKYCCRIWDASIRDEPGQSELRPIVPLVFCQGGETLRRHGLEQGCEIMTYAQQLLEEGRAEGEQHGKVEAAEGFLRVGVTWDVIQAATGLDESQFQALKERLSASAK